jgi:hypothetical protein
MPENYRSVASLFSGIRSADSTSQSMLSSALDLLGFVNQRSGQQPSLRGTGQASQSFPTFERSTPGSQPSTSFTEGTPASPIHMPESEEDLRIRETCGPVSREPFGYYSRESSSLRMSQGTFDTDSSELSLILPNSGSMRDGLLFEQAMSVLPTSERGYSPLPTERLLPTPTSSDGENAGNRDSSTSRAKQGTSLTDVFRLFPTPAARDGKGRDLPTRTRGMGLPHLLLGGLTSQPSEDGSKSREEVPPDQLILWGD